MGDLSLHFSRSEFACNGQNCCGHSSPISIILVRALERLRKIVCLPLIVTSGYRCNVYNSEIAAAPLSAHTHALAADIAIPSRCSLRTLYDAAVSIPAFARGGIGLYPQRRFIHLDIAAGPRAWSQINGVYKPLDAAFHTPEQNQIVNSP